MSCLYNIFFKTNKIYAINCEPCETKYPTNEFIGSKQIAHSLVGYLVSQGSQ